MNNTEHDIELIEKYFDQELDEQQAREFNDRLQQDDGFKKLYHQEKILIDGIRFNAIEGNLHYLKNLEQSLGKVGNPSSQKFNYRWPLAIAAAIGLFIVAYFTLFTPSSSSDELYSAYYKPYPNVFEPTVRGTNSNDDRSRAFQAYESGNYEEAAKLFGQLLQQKQDAGILLLLGNANLMLGKTSEAKENFITLSNNFDELDLQAKWYLSLCYLKTGEKDEAVKILSELGETDITYAIKARELLKKVR